jgi:hypothetical protein
MENRQLRDQELTRRAFLHQAGLGMTSLGAASLMLGSLMGCAPRLQEARDTVIAQNWAANPRIPVPKVGCYTGLSQYSLAYEQAETDLGRLTAAVKTILDRYTMQVGKRPTIYAVSTGVGPLPYLTFNENFPTNRCRAAVANGAIPLVAYQLLPFTTFAEITAGKFDAAVRAFAIKAKEFGHPYFLIPFGESNARNRSENLPFAGRPPTEYPNAHIHMHRIFQDVGANANTVWIIQTITGPTDLNRAPAPFYPGDDYVDWVGFTVQNRTQARWPYQDFRDFFRKDYEWARIEHPKQPVMLVEVGKSNDSSQPMWLRRAYQAIKDEFPAIKAALCWEGRVRTPTGEVWDDQRGLTNPDSIRARREAFADPYFIGSILNR